MKTTHITNTIEVYCLSINTVLQTADTDDQGYYLFNGANRLLCYGISVAGDLVVWLNTNGNPSLLSDGDEIDFARDLADAPAYDLSQGLGRLQELATLLEQNEKCDEHELSWLAERISVIAEMSA